MALGRAECDRIVTVCNTIVLCSSLTTNVQEYSFGFHVIEVFILIELNEKFKIIDLKLVTFKFKLPIFSLIWTLAKNTALLEK